MYLLPTKSVTERLTIVANFADEIPWESTISEVSAEVKVASGIDPTPQKVFWRYSTITGPEVTFQVRAGLPGVIYVVKIGAKVGTSWYFREAKLAVIKDFADGPALFTPTTIVTSHPYPQIWYDQTTSEMIPLRGGRLHVTLIESNLADDRTNPIFRFREGQLFEVPPPEFIDKTSSLAFPASGKLFIPPPGTLDPSKTDVLVRPQTGKMYQQPLGNLPLDKTDAGIVPASGALYTPP